MHELTHTSVKSLRDLTYAGVKPFIE